MWFTDRGDDSLRDQDTAVEIILRHVNPVGDGPCLRQDYFDRAHKVFAHVIQASRNDTRKRSGIVHKHISTVSNLRSGSAANNFNCPVSVG